MTISYDSTDTPPPQPPPEELSPLPPGKVRFVPLGGLGEVGMNCLAIEQREGIVVVDCGITFPNEDLGVDVYRPNFAFLESRAERVLAVVLTHGHEDHVGALPYFLERFRVPIFGPPHALTVATHRISEHRGGVGDLELIETKPRVAIGIGPFTVEPIRVTHSIIDATALAIRTAAGLVVHTGDFKLDPTPLEGEPTDEERLRELGDEGVSLLMSDSTNVDGQGEPRSERDVAKSLESIIGAAAGRVVVGLFASNVPRLKAIGEIAERTGRKIALFGRSLELSAQWGHELQRLAWPAGRLVAREHAQSVPRRELLVLAGGTQAEPNSAMTQLANGTHPALRLEPGDSVVLSSRIIPGNERPVFSLMDAILRQGVELRSFITDPDIHASGHAQRGEQQRMLDLVRPRSFVPVHGTLHHLTRHAGLARARGVSDTLVVENGQCFSLCADGQLTREGNVPCGRIATWSGTDIDDHVLRERRALARGGTLHVTVVIDSRGRLAAPPQIWARGVVGNEREVGALRFVAVEVAKAFEKPARAQRDSDEWRADVARLAARRAVEARTGRKPTCSATVVRVS